MSNKTVLAAGLMATLTGCGSWQAIQQTNAKIQSEMTRVRQIATKPQSRQPLIRYRDDIYVDPEPVVVDRMRAALRRDYRWSVILSEKEPLDIYGIASKITETTGLAVDMDMSGPTTQSGNQLGRGGKQKTMEVRYQGRLDGFLDQVAANFNLYWRYDAEAHKIVLYRYQTRSFTIASLPGAMNVTTGVSNTGSSGANNIGGQNQTANYMNQGSGNSGQKIQYKVQADVWKDIVSSVKNMIGQNGSLAANRSLGLLTVTGTPEVLTRVDRYVKQLNKVLARQVAFDVRVYSVELNDNHQLGIDWALIYKGSKVAVNVLAPQSAMAEGAGKIAAALVRPDSKFQGSGAILQALATQGDVSLLTSTTVVTLSDHAVPVKVSKEISYLASSTSGSTNTASNTSSVLTTQLTPGKVVTGFMMNLLPHVLDTSQVILQYSVDLANLDRIRAIESGTQRIEAPEVSRNSFIQRVAMRSGETLVLTSFDLAEDKTGETGFSSIVTGKNANTTKRVIVITVTPKITNGVSL